MHKAGNAILHAFDLLELDGTCGHRPLGERKKKLAKLLARAPAGIQFNEHTDEDGGTVFRQACKLGLEGIGMSATAAAFSIETPTAPIGTPTTSAGGAGNATGSNSGVFSNLRLSSSKKKGNG